MFTPLTTIDTIHEQIKMHAMTFIYITQPDCSVCHGLQPQLEQLLRLFPKIHTFQIDATEIPSIASDFQVFTAPTLLFFVDGKEYIREARFVQTDKLHDKIERIYQEMVEH